ncbi:MAG TPA: hypothetical protein PLD54_02235 [Candidatus Levybacteria bacterium]|nr:hypothetical protein [Candidatus Levybacteria bacterium]
MKERYKQPRVNKQYLEIVRDPDLLAVAKEESIETYREVYAKCYEIIPDVSQREHLITMAVTSIDKKWQQAMDNYAESEIECTEGNQEACKIKPNREIVLGMFLQVADTERREMGALPFVDSSRSKSSLNAEITHLNTFPTPSPEPITLIDRAAD